jgi:hypothetical protein
MQGLHATHDKDAFHRVPNFAQMRFAICHFALRFLFVRIPTHETSLKETTLSGKPALPGKHFWRVQLDQLCWPRAPFRQQTTTIERK